MTNYLDEQASLECGTGWILLWKEKACPLFCPDSSDPSSCASPNEDCSRKYKPTENGACVIRNHLTWREWYKILEKCAFRHSYISWNPRNVLAYMGIIDSGEENWVAGIYTLPDGSRIVKGE